MVLHMVLSMVLSGRLSGTPEKWLVSGCAAIKRMLRFLLRTVALLCFAQSYSVRGVAPLLCYGSLLFPNSIDSHFSIKSYPARNPAHGYASVQICIGAQNWRIVAFLDAVIGVRTNLPAWQSIVRIERILNSDVSRQVEVIFHSGCT